jgi:hypothetical protein
MNKLITLSLATALCTFAMASEVDYQKQIDDLTKQIEKLEKNQKRDHKKLSKVGAHGAYDNIKFDVDFRTAYDNMKYNMTGTGMNSQGQANPTEYTNDSLFSNRLWLGMGYKPTDTMTFKGQLSFNKAFGASYGQRATGMGFDTFDWIVNETLTDDTIKLREAYWLWTPSTGDIGWTLSVGRRPATNGYLINLRDDDKAKSPMGHIINMEFDGASASIKLDNYVSGMYFKLCAGRGLTNAASWASQATMAMGAPIGGSMQPDYTSVDSSLDNTDMIGIIFKPYDDGQYSVMTKWYRGFNVPGMNLVGMNNMGTPQQAPVYDMQSVGDMDGAAISAKIEGIGDEISDFLDDTIIFASYAWSKSNPNKDINQLNPQTGELITTQSMLGSSDSETGTSYWIGTQMPNMTGGKFGLEYNHGSKYWRPFTYGEDTMIGSKMAVRGSAYEAYWTQPLIEKGGKSIFSMQIRYTYLDYDYTGSGGFFGQGGTPIDVTDKATLNAYNMNAVETAQDLRVYFRYRY